MSSRHEGQDERIPAPEQVLNGVADVNAALVENGDAVADLDRGRNVVSDKDPRHSVLFQRNNIVDQALGVNRV